MSAPGRYTKLAPHSASHPAADRRDPDPLNQLSRRLEPVCRAAVDTYEVAAYLESVGYNRYRVRQEFGLSGPFELADRLYDRVPRRPVAEQSLAAQAEFLWQRHSAVLLTFVTTLALQSNAAATGFEAVLWLIAWSVVGSGVVSHLTTEPDRRQQSVVTTLLGLGLLGLTFSLPWHGFSWTELTVSVLWWNLTGHLWWLQTQGGQEGMPTERGRLSLSLLPVLGVGAVAVATVAGAPLPAWSSAAVALGASLFTLTRRSVKPLPGIWRHLVTPPRQLALLALYGAGQGFLLVRLLQTEPDYLLLGTVVLAAVVLALEWAANGLTRTLAHTLWSSAALHVYRRRARRAALLWLLLLLLPVTFAALREGQLSYGAALFSFLLLGLGLGLGLTLLNLSNLRLPSFGFAAAAVAVALGFAWVDVLALLVVLLALGLLFHLRELESYGVQVL